MPTFFPRQTIEIRLEEPKAFRKFSFSLVEMAIVTGVLLRVYRLFTLTHGSDNWFYIGGAFLIGFAVLFGMLTAHLANYPLHQYAWRAPLFALVEVAAEMTTSAILIAVGHERNGSVAAHWDDWGGMAIGTLSRRGIAIIIWTLILAGVIAIVRRTKLVEEEEDETEEEITRTDNR
jgi:hypothetical protein